MDPRFIDGLYQEQARIISLWHSGQNIENELTVEQHIGADVMNKFKLLAKQRVNEAVYLHLWRRPTTTENIEHNIRLARTFVRSESRTVDANLEKGICLLFNTETTWERFSRDLLDISQRKEIPRPRSLEGTITVAISYKHDAEAEKDGTMSDVRTRRELFEKTRDFHNFVKKDVSLWIDQGLFAAGTPEGTWYERGIVPYTVFPVIFCSAWRGSQCTNKSPWLKIEAALALRGNGMWMQTDIQDAWATMTDDLSDILRFLINNVPCMTTVPEISPSKNLLNIFCRVLVDGSICPGDYRFREDFESFFYWCAERSVLCETKPILATLDEETSLQSSKGIMFLAVKRALVEIATFKFGRYVLLPRVAEWRNQALLSSSDVFDSTLDQVLIAGIGRSVIGATLPSEFRRDPERTEMVFSPNSRNLFKYTATSSASCVSLELVTRTEENNLYSHLIDFDKDLPADECDESPRPTNVRDDWVGDWILSFWHKYSRFKGSMDAAGCTMVLRSLTAEYTSSDPLYTFHIHEDKRILSITKVMSDMLRQEYGIHDIEALSTLRHLRNNLWQREYTTVLLGRKISTAELIMLSKNVVRLEALGISTEGMTISVRDAINYRLFLSQLLTNEKSVLENDLLFFDCSVDREASYLHKRAYSILSQTGGYVLVHVVSDVLENELLIRFGFANRVRVSKLEQYQPRSELGDKSLLTILKMDEKNANCLLHQPILRDLFSGILGESIGLRRLESNETANEGEVIVSVPNQMFFSFGEKEYDVVLRREILEVNGTIRFTTRFMEYTEFPVLAENREGCFLAALVEV